VLDLTNDASLDASAQVATLVEEEGPMLRGPQAFSYIRMSTRRQKDGDSLRRQIELRDLWLARHSGIPLAETFSDLGVSGHKGRHRIKGALSRFAPSRTAMFSEAISCSSRT
jgi:Resolvase, N terminal domain